MVLGIYGSGGAGRGVREIAEGLNKWDKIVFIDDTVEAGEYKGISRMPFADFCKMFSTDEAEIVIALGEPEFKERLYHVVVQAGYGLANVIHKNATVNSWAKLGRGIVMQSGSFVGSDAVIEDNVTLQQCVLVGHDSVIHSHCQISANVVIAGNCEVGAKTYIGLAVPVKEKTTIGHDVIVSMGSVVMRDIPDSVIAMGNPARVMQVRNGERVFSK